MSQTAGVKFDEVMVMNHHDSSLMMILMMMMMMAEVATASQMSQCLFTV